MTVKYRPCTAADVDAVLAFWRLSALGGSSNNAEAIHVRLKHHSALFLLAWDAERLVGTLIGAWDGWRANMYRLAVHPDYRRAGIATELVKRIETELVRMGARRVYALSMLESEEARPFWQAMGYGPNPAVEPLVKRLGAAGPDERGINT